MSLSVGRGLPFINRLESTKALCAAFMASGSTPRLTSSSMAPISSLPPGTPFSTSLRQNCWASLRAGPNNWWYSSWRAHTLTQLDCMGCTIVLDASLERRSSKAPTEENLPVLDITTKKKTDKPVEGRPEERKQQLTFFRSILHTMSLLFRSNKGVPCNLLCSLLISKFGGSISDLDLVFLDSLLSLNIVCIGMLQSNFKLTNITLKLLFHPKGLSLSFGLCLKSGLHALSTFCHIFLDAQELFFLLGNAMVNFLTNLSKLNLGTEYLVLFLFKSTFSFF